MAFHLSMHVVLCFTHLTTFYKHSCVLSIFQWVDPIIFYRLTVCKMEVDGWSNPSIRLLWLFSFSFLGSVVSLPGWNRSYNICFALNYFIVVKKFDIYKLLTVIISCIFENRIYKKCDLVKILHIWFNIYTRLSERKKLFGNIILINFWSILCIL